MLSPIRALFRTRSSSVVEVIDPAQTQTGRLLLRPLRASDRREFLRVLEISRRHLQRWVPLNRPGETDAELFGRLLDQTIQGDRDKSHWRRAAFTENGQLAGMFALHRIERGLEWRADMTWWVAADQAGAGLGAEGVAAALDHALAELPVGLGLHSVYAGIHPENIASRRLAERLGFRIDPSQQSRLLVNGSWQSHDFYVKRVDEPA